MAVYEDKEPAPLLHCDRCGCDSPSDLWWPLGRRHCDVCAAIIALK